MKINDKICLMHHSVFHYLDLFGLLFHLANVHFVFVIHTFGHHASAGDGLLFGGVGLGWENDNVR